MQHPRIPRIHHVQLRSHKMSIMLEGLSPLTKISHLKTEALAALKSEVAAGSLDAGAFDPPEIDVQTEDDFEIYRAVRDKGRPTGEYEPLDYTKNLREAGMAGWEYLYIRFRDRETGELHDVTYYPPPLNDDYMEDQPSAAPDQP